VPGTQRRKDFELKKAECVEERILIREEKKKTRKGSGDDETTLFAERSARRRLSSQAKAITL